MGLSSKLAASQSQGGPPVGTQLGRQQGTGVYQTQAPNPQNPQPTPPPGPGNQHAPPTQGYTTPQPQYPAQQYCGHQPPPSGYGYPSHYPPSQYVSPNPQGPVQTQITASYLRLLESAIEDKKLRAFYPQSSTVLNGIAEKAEVQIDKICSEWCIPKEVGQDIVKLALFDIILYIDDSGSMKFEEKGERIKDLRLILARVAYAASLFDTDGITVEELVDRVAFSGLTPLGTKLREKILDPLVLTPAKQRQLKKPVLVITITDGQPAGEKEGTIFEAIKGASDDLARYNYGRAVFYQFAQVGNDERAREFLAKLDSDRQIGDLVDSTSNYEVEQDEMSNALPPIDLTPELWLVKLLLGAIDSSYDTKDEKSGSRPQASSGQYVAQQSYGAPAGGGPQYQGPPQQQNPLPQQPGYGGQQQYPPQQPGYGGQQQYPPQQPGYGGQQQYPPQQPGYGGQQQYPPQQPGYGGEQQYPPQQPGYGGQRQYPPYPSQ
ncbi:MAG: hypothetical protein M1840_005035 [Geoglossum simile]|nr:MAG: hypothetical protein M1840_005035 [Geoglossum simile]